MAHAGPEELDYGPNEHGPLMAQMLLDPELGDLGAQLEQGLFERKMIYASSEQHYVNEQLNEYPEILDTLPTYTAAAREQRKLYWMRQLNVNRKLRKKAQMRFRHEFAKKKVKQGREVIASSQDIIQRLEERLLCCGYDKAALQRLKHDVGILDRSVGVGSPSRTRLRTSAVVPPPIGESTASRLGRSISF